MRRIAQFLRSLFTDIFRRFARLIRGKGTDLDQAGQGRRVFVVNSNDNTVSVIDIRSQLVIEIIPVGNLPRWIVLTPNGSFALVTNYESLNISVIDTSTLSVVALIPVSYKPYGIAISPDGSKAYVTLPNEDLVAIININNGTNAVVIGFANVGSSPHFAAFTPDGKSVYVTNYHSDDLSVIDTSTDKVVNTINLAIGSSLPMLPLGLAITPDGAHAYIACFHKNVLQYDILNLKLNLFPIGSFNFEQPAIVAISTRPAGERTYNVYITDAQLPGYLNVFADMDFSWVKNIQSGTAGGLAFTPDSAFAYLAIQDGVWADWVAVIDTTSVEVVNHIKVGKGPMGVAI